MLFYNLGNLNLIVKKLSYTVILIYLPLNIRYPVFKGFNIQLQVMSFLYSILNLHPSLSLVFNYFLNIKINIFLGNS